MNQPSVIVIGAGPAGLTAGYELVKRGILPVILERAPQVGGIARTENYKGYRFDVGGHRFYTKVDEVRQIWHEVLGSDFLKRPRLSRIYYQGEFYKYPLSIPNTLSNLGLIESSRIVLSYLKWQAFPHPEEETFEHWVTNRFGQRLYRTFFKTYTEKVWGIPCHNIRADWAAQRIKGLSLKSAVSNALFGTNGAKSLVEEFHYPRLGPGMMWERMRLLLERQMAEIQLNTEVVAINRQGSQIKNIVVRQGEQERIISGDQYISSMPVSHLVLRLQPLPPKAVVHAAQQLKYRDFLIVFLIINQADVFPDNWIYVHSPNVKVGRIQNFKNWSPEMVPDLRKTSLGLEYFCSKGDEIWSRTDNELIRLASREIADLGLIDLAAVEDGFVLRQPRAYPVYDQTYYQHLKTIQSFLCSIENLQTIGRNGMHRYNNQDHSMLTGILAVRNVLGERHNLWDVNTERSYYEEIVLTTSASRAVSSSQPVGAIGC